MGVVSLSLIRLYPHPALLIAASGLFGLGYSPLWIGIITGVAPAGAKNRSSRIGLVFTSWLAGMGAGLAAMTMAWLFYPGAAARDVSANTFCRPAPACIACFGHHRLGLSHDGYGFLIMAGGAAAAIFLIPMGTLADRIGIRAVLFTGLGFSAAALGGLALAGKPHNAVLFTLVLGISYAAVLPAWNTLLARSIPPEGQATRWGVFSTIEGLGISAGPAMGGFLARYHSPSSVLLASAGILAAMALFYLFYPVERMFKNRG